MVKRGGFLDIAIEIENKELKNIDRLTKKGHDRLVAALNRIVSDTADKVVRETQKDMLVGIKTGKTYTLADGRPHTASAKGQTPAVITGTLMKGFDVYKYKHVGSMFAYIKNHVFYADILYGMQRPIIKVTPGTAAEFKAKVREAVKKNLIGFSRK